MSDTTTGTVHLVGAGPGAKDLLTLRAAELLSHCDVLVYDYLVNPEIRRLCNPHCEMIDVGKAPGRHSISQEDIMQILIDRAKAGKNVVRLKGGDPFIFGRGGEEKETLTDHDIPVVITPGITAALGCAAHNGIPLTHRDFSSNITFLTGHERPDRKEPGTDFHAYAKTKGTLCIYMGIGQASRISHDLIEGGLPEDTPTAIIRWGTLPKQETWLTKLSELPSIIEKNEIKAPALLVIGEAANHMEPVEPVHDQPLLGKRVVITRAQKQAGTLREKLEVLGADVLEIPLIQIQPDTVKERMAEIFADIAQYDWILFTSSNGVRYFFDYFHKAYKDIRCLGPMQIGAIGKATAEEIARNRLQIDVQPEKVLSEELTKALLKKENIENLKVLVITGNRNSPKLVETLMLKGKAIVDQLQVYRTDLADPTDTWEAQSFLTEGADAVLFTSSSTVLSYAQHLAEDLKETAKSPLHLSIGPKTSKTLEEQNLSVSGQAEESNLDSLVALLCEKLDAS